MRLLPVALMATITFSAAIPSRAAITLIDSTDISLAPGNGVSNAGGVPVSQTPAGSSPVAYTPSSDAAAFPAPYNEAQLHDGLNSPVANVTADGLEWDIEYAGTLTLTFAKPVTITSVAIYDGYDNRDDGTYTLSDAASDDLGSYTILTPSVDFLSGDDDFLLNLKTPVTTTALTLTMSDLTDYDHTASFEDIQAFESAPEPSTWAMLLAGLVFLGFRLRRQSN